MHLNPSKAGVALGVLIGGWHLLWSLLIAVGLAQPLLDFVFWAHMLNQPFVVQPFDLAACVTLVLITTIIGYILGYCFALIWNRAHKA